MEDKLRQIRTIIKDIKEHAVGDIYLVGGAVRDMLLDREVTDYDFAYAGNAFQFSQKLADKLAGSFVPLDEKNDVARVVIKLEGNNIHLDFAGLKGQDIIADLHNRDFTINAMAIDFTKTDGELIDPLKGREHLAEKQIATIAESSIINDPCRILRGIRLAVELDYTIAEHTLDLFRKHSGKLCAVSAERIRDELFKAFSYNAYRTVTLIQDTRVLEILFPELYAAVGVTQNRHHRFDVWKHTLEVLRQLEENVLQDRELINKDIEEYLDAKLADGRSRKTLLKFAAFLHDVGKPVVRKEHPEKGIIFWNHENVGAQMAKNIASRLKVSKKEEQFIFAVVKHHMRPLFLTNAKASKKAFNKFFNETGEYALAVLLHAIADAKGGKTPDAKKEQALKDTTAQLMGFYFNEYLPQKRAPLADGKDILKLFPGIEPHKIGEILNKLQEQRAIGKIHTREQALELIKSLSRINSK